MEAVCTFYISQKKTLCRMKALPGKTFCPHHSNLSDSIDSAKGVRVPCPFDPMHFCYLEKLEQHKRKCNAREREKPLYYKKNVNRSSELSLTKISIHDVGNEELVQLLDKINKIDQGTIVVSIINNDTVNPTWDECIENFGKKLSCQKHSAQQASLLSLLEKHDLLNTGACFIEFGAGKGKLMYSLINLIPDKKGKIFLLIDREARRYKRDNKFKQNEDVDVTRIRIDIEHLYLGGISALKDLSSQQVVGISKHLCGAATDLALKSLLETLTPESENNQDIKKWPKGLVMSTCCHHRCTWETYTGQEFMKMHNVSASEFQILCVLSSWATCGNIRNTSMEKDKVTQQLNRYTELNLSHEAREKIGRKCKHLIDTGRMEYLRSLGMHSELVKYVDYSISLENVALVGVFK